MAKATVTSLTEKERALVAETQPARLRQLDEDELVDLHARVRRARTKFVTLHRRESGAQVIEADSRGLVNAGPRRSASKAEIFEDTLARVSTSLAKAAVTTRRPSAPSGWRPPVHRPPRARSYEVDRGDGRGRCEAAAHTSSADRAQDCGGDPLDRGSPAGEARRSLAPTRWPPGPGRRTRRATAIDRHDGSSGRARRDR